MVRRPRCFGTGVSLACGSREVFLKQMILWMSLKDKKGSSKQAKILVFPDKVVYTRLGFE